MNFDFLIAMSPCWRRSRDEVNFVGPRSSEFRGAGQQSTQARVDDAGASDVEKCDREVGSEGTAIEGEHAARVERPEEPILRGDKAIQPAVIQMVERRPDTAHHRRPKLAVGVVAAVALERRYLPDEGVAAGRDVEPVAQRDGWHGRVDADKVGRRYHRAARVAAHPRCRRLGWWRRRGWRAWGRNGASKTGSERHESERAGPSESEHDPQVCFALKWSAFLLERRDNRGLDVM